jgi:RNA polymerase sigma factor (sigma-70 family)
MLAKARRAVLRQGTPDQDADEVVQEAFLKVELYQQRHDARSVEGLLVKAAVNLSIDRQRRAARTRTSEVEDLDLFAGAEPSPDAIYEHRARLHHVARGIEQLPERTRRILLKRRLEDMSFAAIAESEGMSVPAVEKQVARATLQLIRWMDEW